MNEAARRLARKVARVIGEVTPRGFGRWDRAWEMVAGPSDEFLDALARWEAEDSAATRARLQEAADRLIWTWRQAAAAWEREGRPTEQEEALAGR